MEIGDKIRVAGPTGIFSNVSDGEWTYMLDGKVVSEEEYRRRRK